MLDKLETAGVRLTAFELGNEINTSRFNRDPPDPGSGLELRLSDLKNPKEGSRVAAGYLALCASSSGTEGLTRPFQTESANAYYLAGSSADAGDYAG